jgi:hypothetical protein
VTFGPGGIGVAQVILAVRSASAIECREGPSTKLVEAETTRPRDIDTGGSDSDVAESIQALKALRIGSMVQQLLDEVKVAPLDEAGRDRLRKIYEVSLHEVAGALSADLAAELGRMTSPFDHPAPSGPELRLAHAQLVGWIEGLFQGIQASILARQLSAEAELNRVRGRERAQGPVQAERTGTYL